MADTTNNKINEEDGQQNSFKKPILMPKIGRLPRQTVSSTSTVDDIKKKLPDSLSTEDEKQSIDKLQVSSTSDSNETTQKATSFFYATVDSTKEQSIFSYIEPTWSALPDPEKEYSFEVLKSGVIIENINLVTKSFWVFGRLPSCDIYMAHPTISRYHTVLQYKKDNSSDRPKGFYIYDLGSIHGTFLNKNRIKPKMYVRIQVGHMLKLGCSTRTFLLNGPENDSELESELTITQLKEKRAEELRERELQELKAKQKEEELKKKEEERGIDWGIGEDADEETDLQINPYAETNNEELYVEDPKKALRGFMEREGHELHYECTERGVGQFLCSIVLPIDDARGRPIVAEALVKGKKKEAVVQCALEACRILDRHGVLRQAMHESKKRKAKNWEDNDYYDSDDDTFLDRTGSIERKREKRMKAKLPQQPETYQSLLVKEENLSGQIEDIEKQLNNIKQSDSSKENESDDTDSLDQFMVDLHSNKPDKYTIGRLKNELVKLRKEHTETVRLVNIARPAHLPPLVTLTATEDSPSTSAAKLPAKKALPMFGKRLKVKVMLPSREIPTTVEGSVEDEEGDEENEIEQDTNEENLSNKNVPVNRKDVIEHLEDKMSKCDKDLSSLDSAVQAKISKTVSKLRKIAEEEETLAVDEKRLAVQKKKIFEQMSTTEASDVEKHMKLSSALTKMTTEFCSIGDRKVKMIGQINKLATQINKIAKEIRTSSKLQHEKAVARMKEFVEKAHENQMHLFSELKKIEDANTHPATIEKLKELYDWLCKQKDILLKNLEELKDTSLSENPKFVEDLIQYEVKKDEFLTSIIQEFKDIRDQDEESPPKRLKPAETEPSTSKQYIPKEQNKIQEESDNEDTETTQNTESKKRKKNIKRIKQRQEKEEIEKKKLYEEDALKEDYNMWVPPQNQSGDGRTSLNDKFGY